MSKTIHIANTDVIPSCSIVVDEQTSKNSIVGKVRPRNDCIKAVISMERIPILEKQVARFGGGLACNIVIYWDNAANGLPLAHAISSEKLML